MQLQRAISDTERMHRVPLLWFHNILPDSHGVRGQCCYRANFCILNLLFAILPSSYQVRVSFLNQFSPRTSPKSHERILPTSSTSRIAALLEGNLSEPIWNSLRRWFGTEDEEENQESDSERKDSEFQSKFNQCRAWGRPGAGLDRGFRQSYERGGDGGIIIVSSKFKVL